MATTQLDLTTLVSGQAGAESTVNTALAWLDALAFLSVIDRDLATPPGSPTEGDRYIVATSGTGAWATHDGEVALYLNAAWAFKAPAEGWTMWVDDENVQILYDGSAWAELRTARVQSVASAATVTPNADTEDLVKVTALAAACQFLNPTPVTRRYEGQRIVIRVKDDATPRGLTYDTQYRAMGTALPSTTVASKTLYLTFVFNATDTTWDLVHAAQEV